MLTTAILSAFMQRGTFLFVLLSALCWVSTAPNFKTSKLVFLVKNWFHMNETRQGLIVKKRLTIGYTREVLLKGKAQYS